MATYASRINVERSNDSNFTKVDIELFTSKLDPKQLYDAKWEEMFPGKLIVKHKYCGQWAVARTECKHCGAPVDDEG